MANPGKLNWFSILTNANTIQSVIQAVSVRVSIQPKDYPKIEKAAVKIAKDRIDQTPVMPPVNRENVDRCVRSIAGQIIDTLISKYPQLEKAAAPTSHLSPPQLVSLGDPRLGQQRLTMTPLSMAYSRAPVAHQPITRASNTRERERELAQRATRRAPRT